MIQAHLMQDGGLQIANIMGFRDCLLADFVSGDSNDSALDSAAGEQRHETFAAVIAAGGVLRPRCTAEFTGEDDQSAIEHAALLEIANEAREMGLSTERHKGS